MKEETIDKAMGKEAILGDFGELFLVEKGSRMTGTNAAASGGAAQEASVTAARGSGPIGTQHYTTPFYYGVPPQFKALN